MARWKEETMLERFESKYIPVTESGCWLWTASSHGRGYGLFHTGRGIRKGKMEFAHRVAYELYKGVRPEANQSVCHSCDNPCCVNPNHLFLGSHDDNMKDMASKNRAGKLSRFTEEDILGILNYPGNTKEAAEFYNLDPGHCSRIRNFKVKKWQYLRDICEG